MPPVGFEPTISVLERTKTVRVLDRAAIAIEAGFFQVMGPDVNICVS
jgi:hypothetical protein